MTRAEDACLNRRVSEAFTKENLKMLLERSLNCGRSGGRSGVLLHSGCAGHGKRESRLFAIW